MDCDDVHQRFTLFDNPGPVKTRRSHLAARTGPVVLALLLLIVVPRDAQAYIDPGTGSLVWQLVLSTVLGGVFYARRTIGIVRRSLARRVRARPKHDVTSIARRDVGE